MLTIGNKTYSSTTPVDDQLVDAIAALPSPFSNLEEDRLATNKELFKILTKEIDLALKLNKESGIGIANNQVQATIDKISKLKKNLQGKTEVDYSLYSNTLFNLYNNFYPPLKDGENVLRIRKLMLDGYQSGFDKDSYMILEGEVGFSDCEKIGTSNAWECVALVIRNKKTLKAALAHIDIFCGEEQIANIFRYLKDGDKEVVLVGASGASADNNKRNVKEILKAILKSVSKGDNVSIHKSYVLAESSVNALVVDPITLNIRSLIPGIRRNNNLNEYFSLSRMFLYSASTKKRNSNISPIEIAFDLTKSKKYIPWESYKSTIGASYFTTFSYSSSNKNYSFTYNSFFSIQNNRLTVNTEGLELDLKKLEKAATSPSRANRNAAFSLSSGLKIIARLAQAYAEAFNDLMDKIESHIPDTTSDKTQIINNIFTKLRTKKIFVDEAAEVFNKILLDKITNELSKLFDNKKESVNKKELQKFYNYLDSKECKIPFSTKMGKPEKLKKMMDFIENSKEYQEYSKSAKPIQGNKSEYALSDMLHIAVHNNDKNLLESLLKYGINVDTKNKYDNTLLHLAIIDSNVQLIKFLLENNANVNEKNKYGNTPLHLAISNNNIEVTELLLNYGAKVDERNDSGEMPLHFAALSGYKEIIEKLVTAGVDINARNKAGWTALMFAARNGHVGVVELLLNHNVKVDEKNKNNSTPLHLAAQAGHAEVVKLLISKGADINAQDKYGRTSLRIAVVDGCIDAAQVLIENEADIHIRSISRKTILDSVKNSQVMIPLLELFAKYKPKDVESFLLDKQDLISKLSKENNLGKELKEVVDEVESKTISKKYNEGSIITLLDDLEIEPVNKEKKIC